MSGSEFRRGWPPLTAALLGNAIGVHSLPPYTIGLFMGPLQAEFDWARTSISAGITVLTICSAISAPFVGSALTRVGAGPLVIGGLGFGSLGYFALSSMGPSVAIFWAIMAAMALLGSGCGPVTLSHLLVTSFERRRGTALGVAMMGIGLSGAVAPFLLGHVVNESGWRMGYVTLGVMMAGAIPVMLFFLVVTKTRFPATAPRRHLPRESIPWTDPIFLRMLAAFFCVALASGGVVVHFVPMLVDNGYVATRASAGASFLGISLVAGRLLTGIIIDRVFAPTVAAVIMLGSSLGFVVLFSLGADWIPLTAVLVGLTLGAELDLIAYLVSRYFAPAAYGRIVGVLYAGFLVGVALSPLVYAILRDAGGSYSPCLLWAAAFLGIGASLFKGLPPFDRPIQSEVQKLTLA